MCQCACHIITSAVTTDKLTKLSNYQQLSSAVVTDTVSKCPQVTKRLQWVFKYFSDPFLLKEFVWMIENKSFCLQHVVTVSRVDQAVQAAIHTRGGRPTDNSLRSRVVDKDLCTRTESLLPAHKTVRKA